MATLELKPAEMELLLEVLGSSLSDLRLEIGDTKKQSYREELKQREVVLKTIIQRIAAHSGNEAEILTMLKQGSVAV